MRVHGDSETGVSEVRAKDEGGMLNLFKWSSESYLNEHRRDTHISFVFRDALDQ